MTNAPRRVWRLPPRTRVKLEIVNKYLGAWFNILAQAGFRSATYLDGFSGPGIYQDGELGSPTLAVVRANECTEKYPQFFAHVVAIDKDERALDVLCSLPQIRTRSARVSFLPKHGRFSDLLPPFLRSGPLASGYPIFSFVDPFGFGAVPLEHLGALLRPKSSELFVNVWCGYINRFKKHPSSRVRHTIEGAIGAKNLARIQQAPDGTSEICRVYEEELRRFARFVFRFDMRDEHDVQDNVFFFCSNEKLGFKKMKEVLWSVDPVNGRSFSEFWFHRSYGLAPLFPAPPNTTELSSQLRSEMQGQRRRVEELDDWVVTETRFLPTHLRTVLEAMLQNYEISYTDPKPTGRRRAQRQWPSRIEIQFQR